MRKIGSFILISALWLLQACSGNRQNSTAMSSDSITTSDSLKAVKDSLPKNRFKDSADVNFVKMVASGCITETKLGQMAQKKGENKRVKNFGAMMIKDLNKANIKIAVLAKSKNITMPVTPEGGDQKTIDDLSQKSGSEFDKAYINEMIDNHKRYITLFENESKNTSDAEIKRFANRTLPALKSHLDAINIINTSLK